MADLLITQSGDFLVTQSGDQLVTQGSSSLMMTEAEMAAAAHVKRPGRGVTPSLVDTDLGRASIAWSLLFDSTPVIGGGGVTDTNLGGVGSSPATIQAVLGGWGSFA